MSTRVNLTVLTSAAVCSRCSAFIEAAHRCGSLQSDAMPSRTLCMPCVDFEMARRESTARIAIGKP